MTQTDAWRVLSTDPDFKPDLFRVTWMGRLARWTGIGSAEQVILARAQFALFVMSFDAMDEEPTLRIRPLAALVIETHTTERRMRPAIERWVKRLAQRVYPQSRTERRMLDGIEFVEWVSTKDGRRIVVAFIGSVAIIGNDARAVQACTLVRRGAKPSLAGNKNLELLRTRVSGDRAVAFGYVSALGLGKIAAFAAQLYFERVSASAEAQQIFSKAAEGILEGAAWATTTEGVSVEDRYFVSLSPDLANPLRDAFAGSSGTSFAANALLPGDTYSFTQYNLQDPRLAWRGLNRAISSHVDILGAVLLNPLLRAVLWPYGIDDPDTFLGAIGPEIVTVRLDGAATTSVLIVQPLDTPTLQRLLSKRLGPGARTERVAPYELRSSIEGTFSAGFVEGRLIMGPPELVRRCLMAKLQRTTLDLAKSARQVSALSASEPPLAVTYTREAESVKGFLSLVSTNSRYAESNTKLLSDIPYSVSTTNLSGNGFEKTTHSTFGLLATLVAQVASELTAE
ncbi:MAG: hypothetical protein ABI596_06355 [Pyrinomonadaceae bacterium]